MIRFLVVAAATLCLAPPARGLASDQRVQLADVSLDPPVVVLIPSSRPPPTPGFLLKQGAVSLGLQAVLVGATALIVTELAKRFLSGSSTDFTTAAIVIIGASLPTSLGYIFLPSIVLTKMADRDVGSIYFQKVFWASGIGSLLWTITILAWPTSSGQSPAPALTFGIAGMFLTTVFQVWMGCMDWDSDPASPTIDVHAPAQVSVRAMPNLPSVSLLSWRF